MKSFRYLLILVLLIFSSSIFAQQRIGYVDTEYILDQIPEFRSAQKQLDDAADGWKTDLQKMQDEIDRLYKNYQAEYVLMPEDTRKQKEEEITTKEKAMNDYKKDKFGAEGELFKKRQTLIKPIQDKAKLHR